MNLCVNLLRSPVQKDSLHFCCPLLCLTNSPGAGCSGEAPASPCCLGRRSTAASRWAGGCRPLRAAHASQAFACPLLTGRNKLAQTPRAQKPGVRAATREKRGSVWPRREAAAAAGGLASPPPRRECGVRSKPFSRAHGFAASWSGCSSLSNLNGKEGFPLALLPVPSIPLAPREPPASPFPLQTALPGDCLGGQGWCRGAAALGAAPALPGRSSGTPSGCEERSPAAHQQPPTCRGWQHHLPGGAERCCLSLPAAAPGSRLPPLMSRPAPQRRASGVSGPFLLVPRRHLSELGNGDTVIIHGLKAHSRHWKMNYVSFISKKQSQSPFVIKFAVRETLLYLITSDISWLLVLETIKV